MLQRLYINNYAIIDEINIDFFDKLNVLTGETGAGKSIIVGALRLILGQRADSNVLLNKNKKSIIEGIFKVENTDEIISVFKENDWDFSNEIIVRREINPTGKSRAFVNDTPVNLSQLLDLSSLLVDLHQQFDTLTLRDTAFQLNVLDALADNFSLLKKYQTQFSAWQNEKTVWEELLAKKSEFDKEYDYIQFQFAELDEAGFKENELEEIDEQLKLMQNSEGIKSALNALTESLSDGENAMVPNIKSLLHQVQPYQALQSELPELLQRLQSAQIELKDIAEEAESIGDKINFDPKEIDILSERLSLGYRLQKKHGVNSTNELLDIQNDLEKKLQAVMDIDEEITQHEKQTKALLKEVETIGKELSAKRLKEIEPFSKTINKLLQQVGMPNARVKVVTKNIPPTLRGTDEVEFLFDANVSSAKNADEGNFASIRKVASGGELSRLMLCIKSLVAESMNMPTLIFDEIDSGISGEAAKQVGIIMKTLSAKRQMICITHQPQIAGKAHKHYFVYKENTKDGIKTNIKILSDEEHILNIAKMISGENPTEAALKNARELAKQ